jgi:hypothetical protein
VLIDEVSAKLLTAVDFPVVGLMNVTVMSFEIPGSGQATKTRPDVTGGGLVEVVVGIVPVVDADVPPASVLAAFDVADEPQAERADMATTMSAIADALACPFAPRFAVMPPTFVSRNECFCRTVVAVC